MNTPAVAIETEYAGCRFRSRLEARWAVFFDALGLEWSYEPQGYEFQSLEPDKPIRYLPDFWLPSLKVWCEVKGVLGVEELRNLVVAASGAGLPPSRTEERCPPGFGHPWADRLLILGDLPEPGDGWAHIRLDLHAADLVVAQRVFFVRVVSGRYKLMRIGDPMPLNHYLIGEEPTAGTLRDLNHGYPMPTYPQDQITAAYRAARQARFEYGETPSPRKAA